MDKISKALNKLNRPEKDNVRLILGAVKKKKFQGLGIKKLKGYDDIFRVKKRKIRIIYRLTKAGDIFILAIERRSDTTPNKFNK